MRSCLPSLSVVPSPLMSRTKAMPKGFSDLSLAEGYTQTSHKSTTNNNSDPRPHLPRSPLTVLGGSVSKHHPEVTAAHVFDGDCHLGGEEKKVKGEIQDYERGGNPIWRDICMSCTFRGNISPSLFHYIELREIHLMK